MKLTHISPNHTEVRVKSGTYLCSYNSIVAHRSTSNKITLGKNWDYSRTTLKKLNNFLNGQSAADTRKKIASGEIAINLELGDNL